MLTNSQIILFLFSTLSIIQIITGLIYDKDKCSCNININIWLIIQGIITLINNILIEFLIYKNKNNLLRLSYFFIFIISLLWIVFGTSTFLSNNFTAF